MYKIYAFLKRNPNLTHDEYRAGHIGYHCGQSRRLKDIRGYLVNIWANRPLRAELGDLYDALCFNEPADFLEHWDGFPQVYFDDRDSWTRARDLEPNRVMAEGLVIDPDWSLADCPHLFLPEPDNPEKFCAHHLHMVEHVLVPVMRAEFKQTKLMQFFNKRTELDDEEFERRVLEDYAPLLAQANNLRGLSVNFRNPDQEEALRGFFADDDWVLGEEGTAVRRAFCSSWCGANEVYFDSVHEFATSQTAPLIADELRALEQELFSALWWLEVDENLIVMPNRSPAPDFYFR